MNKQEVLDKLESTTDSIDDLREELQDKVGELDDLKDEIEMKVDELDDEVDELNDLREEYEDSDDEEKKEVINNNFSIGDMIVALPSANEPYSTTRHNNGFGKVVDVQSKTHIEVFWTSPLTTMTVSVQSKHFKLA